MTRINCGIPPAELNDKHLMAEHRELKRIPNAVRTGRFSLTGQPSSFTLGKGHVKFFYNKLGYLLKRYEELYKECHRRGFNVTWFGDAWSGIDERYMGSYIPSDKDRAIVRQRIREKDTR